MGVDLLHFFNVISTLMATMWSSLYNHYYSWNPLEKWCKSMLTSCIATILFRLHNHCYSWNPLKNGVRNIYSLLYLEKLPYSVSPITQWTLPLNSHWKSVQDIYNMSYILLEMSFQNRQEVAYIAQVCQAEQLSTFCIKIQNLLKKWV